MLLKFNGNLSLTVFINKLCLLISKIKFQACCDYDNLILNTHEFKCNIEQTHQLFVVSARNCVASHTLISEFTLSSIKSHIISL